ncbi:cell surface A33 antigen [Brachyhypopomus gauderio]|uniref:cell surface A33 antigen n=1 Tax=Brachyhypopomus gauderio TaxID=698409 RepID=UPI004041DE9D
MDKWKQRFFGPGMLLFSVGCTIFGLEVTIPQSRYEVARGDEVTITCNFHPKNSENRLTIISWTGEADGSFDDGGITFGTFYSNENHLDIDPMYEGKALIQSNLVTKESKLILKQVTLRESRNIKCRVQIPGDDQGKTSASAALVVLVPPSEPVCKIKGTAEYGQNISLTCISEEGSPAPTYKWESYDVRNVPRPFQLKTSEKDGVLSLVNVSMGTSGYYVCTSSNKVHTAKCNLTLSVIPSTMKIGAAAGIIGGCVAGVAVLVLIIYCCCRNKEKPEEFEMGPPVVEFHDVPEEKDNEHDAGDIRKMSVEGRIDQRETYEKKAEKELNLQRSEDSDHNPNLRVDYDDRRGRPVDRREQDRYDDRRDRYDDRQDHNGDRRDRDDDRRERYPDRRDRYDDRQDRYDDRRDRSNDRLDRIGDGRDHYDDRQERYDDRRDRSNDRLDRIGDGRDHYDDRQERYDDRRDRSNDRLDRIGDRRDRSNDRLDRIGDRRDYDDRQERYDDRRDCYDARRDRYDDRQDYSDRNDRRNSSGQL